jgi:hypothetical protein
MENSTHCSEISMHMRQPDNSKQISTQRSKFACPLSETNQKKIENQQK